MRREEAERQADQPPRAQGHTGRLATSSTTRAKLPSRANHRRTAAHLNAWSSGLWSAVASSPLGTVPSSCSWTQLPGLAPPMALSFPLLRRSSTKPQAPCVASCGAHAGHPGPGTAGPAPAADQLWRHHSRQPLRPVGRGGPGSGHAGQRRDRVLPVSYTHLTLPTNREV